MSLEKCKKSLPNFPCDIIDSWLSTYVETEGWPPCPDNSQVPQNRWKLLLGNRPVQYWQNITWETVELSVFSIPLEHDSKIRLGQLVDAFEKGTTKELGEDSHNRFWALLRYIAEYGEIPVQPIFLKQEGGFELMDGYHRISAGMAWFKLQHDKEFTDLLDFKPKPFFGNFNTWIGRKEGEEGVGPIK